MKLFENESKNKDYLFNKLKDNKEITENKCHIGTEIPVPYKHLYMPVRNSLEISCYRQDICIYQKLYDKSICSEKITINTGSKKIFDIVIEDKALLKKDIGMPFVTIETKQGDVKPESLFIASEKITMIKSIFPYCISFLLVFGTEHPRILRNCLCFDDILFLPDLSDGECKCVIEKIIAGLNKGCGYVPLIASYNYPYESE